MYIITDIGLGSIVVLDVHHISDQQDGKLLSWVCDHLPQSTSSKIICHSEYID